MKGSLRRFASPAVAVALILILALAAACNGDDDGDGNGDGNGDAAPTATTEAPDGDGTQDGATTIDVSLTEFAVGLSASSAAAGTVTFNVSSDGAIVHNLRVIKTDLDPDALPVDEGTFTVNEADVEVVASSGNLETGNTEELVADLESGSYVLICNIPTHYDAGMFTAFTVE